MTPRSNAKSSCTPVSSRCVVWEGQDIPCISLCSGDSIDQVVFKMATVLCNAADGSGIDISDMQLDCVLEEYETRPDDVVGLLQKIINKVCTIDEAITVIEGGTLNEPILNLPEGLHYDDPNGDHIEQLGHSAYSYHLAILIAGLVTTINNYNTTLNGYNTRLTTAEEAIAGFTAPVEDLLVQLQCLPGAGIDLTLDAAILAIEDAVCDVNATLGIVSAINAAIALQAGDLALAPRLSGIGTMGIIPGWIGTPLTIADTIANLWLTINDMRLKVTSVAISVAPTVGDFILNYSATLSSDRRVLTLATNSLSVIPIGFTITEGTVPTLTISDGISLKNVTVENFVDLTRIGGVKVINLDNIDVVFGNTLNLTLTVSMTTPSGVVASKEKSISLINAICIKISVSSVMSVAGETIASVNWIKPVNVFPTGYRINLISNPETIPVLVNSFNIVNPEQTLLDITGLTAATPYLAEVYVTYPCGESLAKTSSFTTAAIGGGNVLPDNFDQYTISIQGPGHSLDNPAEQLTVYVDFEFIEPVYGLMTYVTLEATGNVPESTVVDVLKGTSAPRLQSGTTSSVGYNISII